MTIPSPDRGGSHPPSPALSGFGVPLGVLFVLSARLCLVPERGVTFAARNPPKGVVTSSLWAAATVGVTECGRLASELATDAPLATATLGVNGVRFRARAAAAGWRGRSLGGMVGSALSSGRDSSGATKAGSATDHRVLAVCMIERRRMVGKRVRSQALCRGRAMLFSLAGELRRRCVVVRQWVKGVGVDGLMSRCLGRCLIAFHNSDGGSRMDVAWRPAAQKE